MFYMDSWYVESKLHADYFWLGQMTWSHPGFPTYENYIYDGENILKTAVIRTFWVFLSTFRFLEHCLWSFFTFNLLLVLSFYYYNIDEIVGNVKLITTLRTVLSQIICWRAIFGLYGKFCRPVLILFSNNLSFPSSHPSCKSKIITHYVVVW